MDRFHFCVLLQLYVFPVLDPDPYFALRLDYSLRDRAVFLHLAVEEIDVIELCKRDRLVLVILLLYPGNSQFIVFLVDLRVTVFRDLFYLELYAFRKLCACVKIRIDGIVLRFEHQLCLFRDQPDALFLLVSGSLLICSGLLSGGIIC